MLVKQVALGAADTVLRTLVFTAGSHGTRGHRESAGGLVTGGPVCTRSPRGWPQPRFQPVEVGITMGEAKETASAEGPTLQALRSRELPHACLQVPGVLWPLTRSPLP